MASLDHLIPGVGKTLYFNDPNQHLIEIRTCGV